MYVENGHRIFLFEVEFYLARIIIMIAEKLAMCNAPIHYMD